MPESKTSGSQLIAVAARFRESKQLVGASTGNPLPNDASTSNSHQTANTSLENRTSTNTTTQNRRSTHFVMRMLTDDKRTVIETPWPEVQQQLQEFGVNFY
jgi:hypothetical protein